MSRAEQIRISRRAERARRLWASAFNLPNQLTTARLVLAIVMFACVAAEHYLAGMVLFIIAAGTDWLDGYFARKWNQVTNLGRILDPFADKVIVCGAFIFARTSGWPALVDVLTVCVAILFSGAVGVFFGFYPAFKASRLHPIEALRHE